jgi:hypothetical protein
LPGFSQEQIPLAAVW